MRGWLGKAGYGGSDVACILVCISSVMRVRGPAAIYQALATWIIMTVIACILLWIEGWLHTAFTYFTAIAHYSHSIPDQVVFIIHQWPYTVLSCNWWRRNSGSSSTTFLDMDTKVLHYCCKMAALHLLRSSTRSTRPDTSSRAKKFCSALLNFRWCT